MSNPIKGLTSKRYARVLRKQIDPHQARGAEAIHPGTPMPYENEETTHFSIMDKAGNAVANTYTLNFSFGTGIVTPGTGVLLNNEMDDFSAKPGVANAYGLIGAEANAIEQRKRPLSSMSSYPRYARWKTLSRYRRPWWESYYHHHITNSFKCHRSNVIDHKMNIAAATAAPRIHHQWLPDYLRVEQGLSRDTIERLNTRGHQVKIKRAMGSVQSVMRTEAGFFGASDTRRRGALTIGY